MSTYKFTVLAALALVAAHLNAQALDFNTIVNWTNGTLPHYACGAPGESACFTGCANSNGISLYGDPYTGTVNCDLPPSVCTMFGAQVPINPHDVTFLVMTDVHLRDGHGITDLEHTLHTHFMRQIGSNGWKWNQSNAGFPADLIAHPFAVVSTGDETDDGQQTSLGAFRLLYEAGWSTDSNVLPLFPGLGNHDVQTDCQFDNCAKRMLDYAGTAASCNLNGVDSSSKNYSWDWGKYHMVQLNNWAGDTQAGVNNSFHPEVADTHASGLPWLIVDLATHVGTSGRPVIFFQHYGWDPLSITTLNDDGTPKYWSDSDRQSFLNAIKDYNVAAIISGHDHNLASYAVPVTDSHGNQKVLEDIVGGTGGQNGTGEFFIVRLTDQFLDLMPTQWHDPVIFPLIASPAPVDMGITGRPAFFNNVQGCRKWVGSALHSAPLNGSLNSNSYTITNNTGNTVQGPFALEFDSLGGPLTPASGQTLFTTNCAVGPLYVLGQKTSLAPGASETISLDTSYSRTISNIVTIGGDYLQASPSPVVVSATASQPVHVTTAYGASIPFTAASDQPWLVISTDSSQTPATLTLSVDASQVSTTQHAVVMISSTNSAYPQAQFIVTIAPVPITFTSPDQEQITVDGQVVTTPITLSFPLNSSHKVFAQTQTPRTGVQDRFLGWTQPGDTTAFNVFSQPFTIAVKFQQYVQLTTNVTPGNGGTIAVTPTVADGFYIPGTPLHLTANANAGFGFSSFESQPQGQNPLDVTMANTPLSIQAKFLPAGSYSVSTSLGASGSETIDGVTTQGPATAQWSNNSVHQVSVPPLFSTGPGTQYVFTQWSDGVTTASRGITAGSIVSFVAQYQQQFLVNILASPPSGGTVSGGGWYNANASANLTATAANGFNFSGFSGDSTSAQSPFALTITQPENIVANFAPGTPILVVSAGAHTNSGPNSTQLTLVLTNIGPGTAVSTIVDSIVGVVQSGTGTIPPPLGSPLPFNVAPGQAVSFSYPLIWPSTATRVAFTVHFTANGGAYSGKTTFYVVR